MGSANSACDRWTDPPTERHNAGSYDFSAGISIRFGVFPICVLECPRYSSLATRLGKVALIQGWLSVAPEGLAYEVEV